MKFLRVVILILFCVGLQPALSIKLDSPRNYEDKNELFVFIFKGPQSKRFHESSSCQGLRNCSTKIYEVAISEAKSIGRTPCGYCY